MATIKRFEDLEAWKRARAMSRKAHSVTRVGNFAKEFGLKDHIRRAAVSTMSNIAEGFERGGNQEFLQFLATAKGSCGEVRSQLYVALDERYVTQKQFDELYADAEAISRMIAGLMDHLQKSDFRGAKYKR